MNPDYMLACGIVWRKTADPEAGWELVKVSNPGIHSSVCWHRRSWLRAEKTRWACWRVLSRREP